MTMTLPLSPPVPARSASLEPVLLVIVALLGAIQGLEGWSELSAVETSEIPGYSLWGLTILAMMVLHPLLGVLAVAFALLRRLRWGIAALGLLVLTTWVPNMPSAIKDGLVLQGDAFIIVREIYTSIGSPALALLVIAAAWFNRYLAAATIAVMLPPIGTAAGVVAFAISVMMYGF